jgi:5-methylcytosine-specific restriction enzyme A
VHHVLSKANGGKDTHDNLIAINTECHKRITAAEQGKTLKNKVRTGLDGYPLPDIGRGG